MLSRFAFTPALYRADCVHPLSNANKGECVDGLGWGFSDCYAATTVSGYTYLRRLAGAICVHTNGNVKLTLSVHLMAIFPHWAHELSSVHGG